jgi:hypothetical protein
LLHIASTGVEPDYLRGILLPSIFVGISAGCSFAMLVGASMRDIPPPRFGMAGAGRTTVFQLSVALGIALAVAIIGRPERPEDALDAMRRGWIVFAVLFALQAVTFATIFPKRE